MLNYPSRKNGYAREEACVTLSYTLSENYRIVYSYMSHICLLSRLLVHVHYIYCTRSPKFMPTTRYGLRKFAKSTTRIHEGHQKHTMIFVFLLISTNQKIHNNLKMYIYNHRCM